MRAAGLGRIVTHLVRRRARRRHRGLRPLRRVEGRRDRADQGAGHGVVGDGVLVNVVAPRACARRCSPAWTDGLAAAIPVGRIGEPDDVAAAVAFLCSAHASYVSGEVVRAERRLVVTEAPSDGTRKPATDREPDHWVTGLDGGRPTGSTGWRSGWPRSSLDATVVFGAVNVAHLGGYARYYGGPAGRRDRPRRIPHAGGDARRGARRPRAGRRRRGARLRRARLRSQPQPAAAARRRWSRESDVGAIGHADRLQRRDRRDGRAAAGQRRRRAGRRGRHAPPDPAAQGRGRAGQGAARLRAVPGSASARSGSSPSSRGSPRSSCSRRRSRRRRTRTARRSSFSPICCPGRRPPKVCCPIHVASPRVVE